MRCKGTIKTKNKLGKNIIQQCGNKLDDHTIFCPVCGEPTGALKNELSAFTNLKEAWQQFWPQKSSYFAFALLMILVAICPIALSVYFAEGNYWLTNLFLLFTVPLALIPLASDKDFLKQGLTPASFLKHLKYYPRFWLFTLMNIAWFLLINILCTGFLLNVATDPILHPARLILVLYWLAIVMPIPFLISRLKFNPFSALKIAYKACAETRWQHFFLLLFIVLINIIGVALIGIGLLVTIPFSYILLDRYFLHLEEFELFS